MLCKLIYLLTHHCHHSNLKWKLICSL